MGDSLAIIDMGRKVGAAVHLSVGELGPHLTQCRLDRGLPSGILIRPTVWPQFTNVTDRQERSRTIGRTVTFNDRPKIN